MTDPVQAKRIKIMAVFVILLLLAFVVKSNMGSSSGGGVLDKIIGANVDKKYQDFKSATVQRNLIMAEKIEFERLENNLIEERVNFWSYTKAGTPRAEAQQKILRLAKDMGLNNIRVNVGSERNQTGCQYLRYIDYSLSCRDFSMKSIADFMDVVDRDTNKFYWKDFKIYKSGKHLVFIAKIRIYVFNKKAVTLFGRN